MKDWRSFERKVRFNWMIEEDGNDILRSYLADDDRDDLLSSFSTDRVYDIDDADLSG